MLAQTTPAPALPAAGAATSVDVLIWVGALIVAVLLLGIVILLLRKRLFGKDVDEASDMLNELRRMHKSGEMSTQEYDAARKALTARFASRSTTSTAAAESAKPRPAPSRAAPPAQPGEIRAKPGFDLTGAPLPKPPRPPAPPAGPYDRKPPTNH